MKLRVKESTLINGRAPDFGLGVNNLQYGNTTIWENVLISIQNKPKVEYFIFYET